MTSRALVTEAERGEDYCMVWRALSVSIADMHASRPRVPTTCVEAEQARCDAVGTRELCPCALRPRAAAAAVVCGWCILVLAVAVAIALRLG